MIEELPTERFRFYQELGRHNLVLIASSVKLCNGSPQGAKEYLFRHTRWFCYEMFPISSKYVELWLKVMVAKLTTCSLMNQRLIT